MDSIFSEKDLLRNRDLDGMDSRTLNHIFDRLQAHEREIESLKEVNYYSLEIA